MFCENVETAVKFQEQVKITKRQYFCYLPILAFNNYFAWLPLSAYLPLPAQGQTDEVTTQTTK